MKTEIVAFNEAQKAEEREICNLLMKEINTHIPRAESKIWHAHPVWFLGGNPIVGYNKLKDCIRLMFWSGQSFAEPGLQPSGSFKAAVFRYTDKEQIDKKDIERWLSKAQDVQWDYKNIIKNKGKLKRIKAFGKS